jgi:carnitine O-acetyltransferase
VHGKCGATYESASLRRYHLGRTETIRSCTQEAHHFAQAMVEQHNQTSLHGKFQLFNDAIRAHRQYTNDVTHDRSTRIGTSRVMDRFQALHAKAIDRHLLGLRLIAAEHQLPRPKLYDHFSYKRAMHFVLSTSQVRTHCSIGCRRLNTCFCRSLQGMTA